MLTVLSAPGSPGASATALYLAAHWAESGHEVLFIEADPAGGTLSHHLGVQFTPGSASFLAAKLDFKAGTLVEHSQDVLYNNLHVMPCTANPTGSGNIVTFFGNNAEALRDISESGMAVVVDGGRLSADSATSPLVLYSAAVLVVSGGEGSDWLNHAARLPSTESPSGGPTKRVVTIGDSPWSESEWLERTGLVLSGSVLESQEVLSDLSAFVGRNKRRLKRWRQSLNAVAGTLLPDAAPESGRPRPQSRAAEGAAAGSEAPQRPAPPEPTVPGAAAAPVPTPYENPPAPPAYNPAAAPPPQPPAPVAPPPLAMAPPQAPVAPPPPTAPPPPPLAVAPPTGPPVQTPTAYAPPMGPAAAPPPPNPYTTPVEQAPAPQTAPPPPPPNPYTTPVEQAPAPQTAPPPPPPGPYAAPVNPPTAPPMPHEAAAAAQPTHGPAAALPPHDPATARYPLQEVPPPPAEHPQAPEPVASGSFRDWATKLHGGVSEPRPAADGHGAF